MIPKQSVKYQISHILLPWKSNGLLILFVKRQALPMLPLWMLNRAFHEVRTYYCRIPKWNLWSWSCNLDFSSWCLSVFISMATDQYTTLWMNVLFLFNLYNKAFPVENPWEDKKGELDLESGIIFWEDTAQMKGKWCHVAMSCSHFYISSLFYQKGRFSWFIQRLLQIYCHLSLGLGMSHLLLPVFLVNLFTAF